MLGFLGTGHFLNISLALLAMSSIGNTLWTEVKDVESHVLGFCYGVANTVGFRAN